MKIITAPKGLFNGIPQDAKIDRQDVDLYLKEGYIRIRVKWYPKGAGYYGYKKDDYQYQITGVDVKKIECKWGTLYDLTIHTEGDGVFQTTEHEINEGELNRLQHGVKVHNSFLNRLKED